MKRLFIILLTGLFLLPHSFGQQDSVKVSLLTYSPLPDISGAFGHSAIRIQNFTKKTDVLYNYGIYDSYEENFIMKFLRGKLQYQLGKQNTRRVFNGYKARGTRQIIEQELYLMPDEAARVATVLETNYLPENRKYYYDFFFDNCATRIRDILEETLGTKLKYKPELKETLTLRQLLDVHVASRPWTDFGMDLLVGIPSDKTATYQEQMFLPGFLSKNLSEGVEVMRSDSIGNHMNQLLGEKKLVVDGENYMNKPTWLSPFILFGSICLLMLILTLVYKHNQLLFYLDGILFLILGIVGGILLFMWLGTDHDATKWNLNIIWANPLYLLLFFPVLKRNKKWMKVTYGLALFSSIIILLSWGGFFQQFHLGILPIIIMMLARSSSAFLYMKRDAQA